MTALEDPPEVAQKDEPVDYNDGYRSPTFRVSGAGMFVASAADLATTELGNLHATFQAGQHNSKFLLARPLPTTLLSHRLTLLSKSS